MSWSKARNVVRRILPARLYGLLGRYLIAPVKRVLARLAFVLPFSLLRKYGYPPFLSIFLTTRCNLRCFICRREGFKGQDLQFGNLARLEQAIRNARIVELTGWGEAFLYPRFEDVLYYIYALNPRDDLIRITTNGTKLSARWARLLSGHLNSLVVSLNAATAQTYNRDMQYGDFDQTLANVRAFIAALDPKDRAKVRLSFVAHTENYREIPDFVALAHELGVAEVVIANYYVGIVEHSRYSLLNVKTEYNAAVERAQELGTRLGVRVSARRFFSEEGQPPQKCQAPFTECYIEVTGDVGPCCHAGSYRLGNAYESGFEAVWFGEAYRRLRKKRYLPACQSCTPFIPFDDYRAHFTAFLKETDDLKKVQRELGVAEKVS